MATDTPSDDVFAQLKATHLETGPKGTQLYRVDGHFDPGRPAYCITMIDDPSTGLRNLEWVDPDVGEQHDAELCQANLFGIDLRDWLSSNSEA